MPVYVGDPDTKSSQDMFFRLRIVCYGPAGNRVLIRRRFISTLNRIQRILCVYNGSRTAPHG